MLPVNSASTSRFQYNNISFLENILRCSVTDTFRFSCQKLRITMELWLHDVGWLFFKFRIEGQSRCLYHKHEYNFKSESWKIVVVFLITCTIYNVSLRRKTWWSTSLHPQNKQNNSLITLFLLGVITVAYTQYLCTFWDQSWCPKWGETNIFPYYIYNCSWALAPYLSN